MPGLVVLDEERASETVDVELMFGRARNCEGDGVGEETAGDSAGIGVVVTRARDSCSSLVSGRWDIPVGNVQTW